MAHQMQSGTGIDLSIKPEVVYIVIAWPNLRMIQDCVNFQKQLRKKVIMKSLGERDFSAQEN